jgi:hypothetical protein
MVSVSVLGADSMGDEGKLIFIATQNAADVYRIENNAFRPLFYGNLGYQLRKAEVESQTVDTRYTHEEVFAHIRRTVTEAMGR